MSNHTPILPSGKYQGFHFGQLVEKDEAYARRLYKKPGLRKAYPAIYDGLDLLLGVYSAYREIGLPLPHYSQIMP